jgi:two-component system, LytTR family, sensor kinase
MNSNIDTKRLKLFAWIGLAYLCLWLLSDLANYPDTFFPRIANNIWRAIYIVALNFIFFEYTLKYVSLKRRKILLSALILAIQLLLFSFGLYAWRSIGILLHVYIPLRSDAWSLDEVCYHFPYSVMSIFFFAIIRHVHDYNKLKADAQQLRIEKQEAELNFLKSQTNPHFLFNTLNNIYALARDKSDLTPESVLRLSKILRFMLYETGSGDIHLEQELKVIQDYIALEKLRYDDNLHVEFKQDVQDGQQKLPPLLLIPLVENAFKHGTSETRGQPFVDIQVSVEREQLRFVVKNSSEKTPEVASPGKAIGLANLRRQLELLFTDYELNVQQVDSIFTASLRINLSSHV